MYYEKIFFNMLRILFESLFLVAPPFNKKLNSEYDFNR